MIVTSWTWLSLRPAPVIWMNSARFCRSAIVFEPVQGEGGFIPAPPEFVRGLREVCDEHGIVLVCDEVQSGFARTGRFFAIEHFAGVEPDLITVAKSIAMGIPLSGVLGKAAIMDAPVEGGVGGDLRRVAAVCGACGGRAPAVIPAMAGTHAAPSPPHQCSAHATNRAPRPPASTSSARGLPLMPR